jgi:hypothetical protein
VWALENRPLVTDGPALTKFPAPSQEQPIDIQRIPSGGRH